MGRVCEDALSLHRGDYPKSDGFHKSHGTELHSLNILHFRLVNLGYATEFEQSSLAFINRLTAEYHDMRDKLNLPKLSPRQGELYRQKIRDLESKAQLRQALRVTYEKQVERYVTMVRGHVEMLKSNFLEHEKLTIRCTDPKQECRERQFR